MQLIYIGPDPAVVGVVPLPEGWSALDHEEPDSALAEAKVASGSYTPANSAPDVPSMERVVEADAEPKANDPPGAKAQTADEEPGGPVEPKDEE